MSAITIQQMATIKVILGIVETGKKSKQPDLLTVLEDGAGITFGMHQATENAGSLWDIIFKYYVTREDAQFKAEFEPYRKILYHKEKGKVVGKKFALTENDDFKELLVKAAQEDPAMTQAQKNMFHVEYFLPALALANDYSVEHALGLLICYDMSIHSGKDTARAQVAKFDAEWAEKNTEEDAEEEELKKAWIQDLIQWRHAWLENHGSKIVRNTRYRTASYALLAENEQWDLALPLTFVLNRTGAGLGGSNTKYVITAEDIANV